MVLDQAAHPSVMQWNNYRPAPARANGESSDLFPNISTADVLGNPLLPHQQQQHPQQAVHSPVNQVHQQHDINSPTSTTSRNSQQFEDYRYSHGSANWLYGGSNNSVAHNNGDFPLDPNHNSTSFDDVNTTFQSEDSTKPRTESSLTSISSPGYSSLIDSPSKRGRASSTPNSSKGKVHKDATGKTKRSRMGCLTCRHRKKRCCERRPTCHECERLGLRCSWPAPGLEHRNRPKNAKINDDMHYDAFYGHIKILRGIVEYRINATS